MTNQSCHGRGPSGKPQWLPSDQPSCMDGHVVRNGEIVDEPYLARDTVTDRTPVTVGEGQLYTD